MLAGETELDVDVHAAWTDEGRASCIGWLWQRVCDLPLSFLISVTYLPDGSVLDDKVGATAALTRPGKSHHALHNHLGCRTSRGMRSGTGTFHSLICSAT